ncbi:MAG: HAMP domain-containing protein, partial [Candidatus Aminicenantes bacterium]|nr:HAMP domain-containing protein [Candidatus Aminicenantes bacterium]
MNHCLNLRKRKITAAELYFLAAALILLAFALFLLNSWLPRKYAQASEEKLFSALRDRAADLRQEFSRILQQEQNEINAAEKKLQTASEQEAYQLLKGTELNVQTDGWAWLDQNLKPLFWFGNVADLEPQVVDRSGIKSSLLEQSFVIRERASYFLVSLRQIRENRVLARFKLLAFRPQFQSTYLKEFELLASAQRAGIDVNFWEYTADIQSLENLFSRHNDEYFSPQREERESRSLYFPLRNEKGRILATVTLNSLQLWEKKIDSFQYLKLSAYLFFSLAVIFLLMGTFKTGLKNHRRGKIILWVGSFLGLSLIRLILIPASELKLLTRLRIFSPELAAVPTSIKILKSPADIFLTVFLVSVFFYLTEKIFFRKKPEDISISRENPTKPGQPVQIIRLGLVSNLTAFLIFIIVYLTKKIVLNSNLNLTGFNFSLSALLLYLSLFLLAFSALIFLVTPLLSLSSKSSFYNFNEYLIKNYLIYLSGGLLFYAVIILIRATAPAFLAQVLLWILLPFILAKLKPGLYANILLLFLASSLQFYVIHTSTLHKTHQLTESVLVHQVVTQKSWGKMVLQQSFSELQKKKREITSFFSSPSERNFARYLWNKTIISRFNWNSCLYLQSQDKKVISYFSLNLPLFPEQIDPLPFSPQPEFQEYFLDIMGREKHFLVGYQDFGRPENPLGRLVIWLSLDPELLPFYHSANPYFELLRLNTLPSLRNFPVDLVVFNQTGQILYNTSRLVFPLPEVSPKSSVGSGTWIDLKTENGVLRSYVLLHEDSNIYVFFYLKPTFRNILTAFLKIFFLYLVFSCLYLFLRLLKHKKHLQLAQTFSVRVYLAFFAATLLPLFLFIFFTQNMVQKIFSDRFVQEATSRAYFARSILDDFISFQEQSSHRPAEIPQDLVFWISNTLNNDVNLFKNGRYLSSSRAEFFETGIMPQLLDGETCYRLTFLKEPLVVSRRTIGTFSYQTLTIPFPYQEDVYFLSLPFPLEQMEISETTRQVIEFLLFSSFFLLLLIALFARTIKRMIIVPIDKLIRATREVSLGRLDVRVEHQAQDELRHLVDGFNSMVESLKEHEKELAEMSQKLAWTEMARKVAHEIKNPLTPIKLSAEHILKVYKDKHPDFGRILQESTSYIISEVENLRRIAQDFMAMAREEGESKGPVDLVPLVEELLGPFKNTLSERINFEFKTEGQKFVVLGSQGKIKVAIRNIIINAVEAIKNRGQV